MENQQQQSFIQMIKSKGLHWPMMIVALLLSGIVMDLCVLFLASDSQGLAVKENYYELSSNYEEIKQQAKVNRELGWKLEAEIVAMTSFRSRLKLSLLDANGQRVENAQLSVRIYHKTRPKGSIESTLKDNGDGLYLEVLPLRQAGAYQIEVVAEQSDKRFTQSLTANLWRS